MPNFSKYILKQNSDFKLIDTAQAKCKYRSELATDSNSCSNK